MLNRQMELIKQHRLESADVCRDEGRMKVTLSLVHSTSAKVCLKGRIHF